MSWLSRLNACSQALPAFDAWNPYRESFPLTSECTQHHDPLPIYGLETKRVIMKLCSRYYGSYPHHS